MTQAQITKLVAALDSLDLFLDLLEELVTEETTPSCAEHGHACHHCTECDPS